MWLDEHMTRTNETHHTNVTDDGKDVEFLRQQERARQFVEATRRLTATGDRG